jgi:hypothetical protein
MSTEETREGELKEEEEEEAKSESSIVLSSLGAVASTRTRLQIGLPTGIRLQIGLPIVTPGLPIGIPIPATITTTKVKDIDFDNYDIDIMSSDSYIKSIPNIKSGITAA